MAPAIRSTHLAMLLICGGMLLAAAFGRIDGAQQVSLGGKRLPSLCAWRNVAGIDCAGCGMTRAFVCLAHGELRRSFDYHHVGLPLFLLVALQVPYRLLRLLRPAVGPAGLRLARAGDYTLLALVLVALADWLVRLVFLQ